MVGVDPDWWKTLFDEVYLITDARSVCDEQLTSREVDFLVHTLDLKKSWPILDLCGDMDAIRWSYLGEVLIT